MSLLQNSNAISAGGYDINNSLRFRSSASAYLNRTPASAGNRKTWTWSAWVKRGELSTRHDFFSAGTASNNTDTMAIRFDSSANLTLAMWSADIFQTSQLFRDPSAWYHIVLAMDTTQATASNRTKLYINGAQVTNFTSISYPSQNADLGINGNVVHNIGRLAFSGGAFYFDGYMAEVNFIDGSAKTPSDFGETDTTTGVWKPKAYSGTYGTNGFYLPFTNANTSSHAGSFNGSSQGLTFTPTSNIVFGSSDYTVEAWVNFNSIGGSTQLIYQSGSSGTNNFYLSCQSGFVGVGTQSVYVSQQSTTLTANKWYHIVACRASGTLRLFVNGTQIGSSVTDSTSWLASGTASIGYAQYVSGQYLNGLISNIRVLKGTGLYTSNFIPPSSPLTAITNTQLLTLQNSSIVDNSANAYTITNVGSVTTSTSYPFSANIASDQSGNANNWITNNIQVATPSATTYDAMTDSPTLTSATVANYATLNPNLRQTGTGQAPTSANLKLTANTTGYSQVCCATIASPSGKFYWEVTLNNVYGGFGIADSNNSAFTSVVCTTSSVTANPGQYTWGWNLDINNGNKQNNNVTTSYGSGASSGDVYMCAVDIDNGKVWWGKNGTWFASGNPASGTNAAFTNVSGNIIPYFSPTDAGGSTQDVNFGQRPFAYTPPTGFNRLNTYNLPDSTIKKGNSYMDATLYTGNGGTLSVTNAASFQPDLVWIKSRSNARDNALADSVRGVLKDVASNTTAAETTNTNYLTAFNSDGFTIGDLLKINASGNTFVAWQWKAGSSTVTNTSGTISSQVRANTTTGFSIVTYTGNGTLGATVGHGLGVAPRVILIKSRSILENWAGYFSVLGNGVTINLNASTGAGGSSEWNSTTPTSTVFTIGNGSGNNQNNATYVAYCWSEISGFSRFGSYTGNGSADGPFVYLGFRPKYILFKQSSASGEHWIVFDSTRTTYNIMGVYLHPSLSNAESTFDSNDFLSNGFKIRVNHPALNTNGATYIYMAFAENPFKNSLAR